MRPVLPLALALLALTPSARADMNETFDVSGVFAHGGATVHDEATTATGLGTRMGVTFGAARFGSGIYGQAAPLGGERARWLSAEAYAGFAPNGYWQLRPSIELRAHADRIEVAGDVTVLGGVGPRFGVLLPLDEYFFVDVGLSHDLIGPEGFRGTIGLGLPIPLSHL